jgi:hypothetical protein
MKKLIYIVIMHKDFKKKTNTMPMIKLQKKSKAFKDD